jgi:hypothetical protein
MLLVLVAGMLVGASAGEMLMPVCHDCGWSGQTLYFGQGPDDLEPLRLVYLASRGYAEVSFDLPAIYALMLGLDEPTHGGRWELVESMDGLYEFIYAWEPPSVLWTGRLPAGVSVTGLTYKDLMEPRVLRLIERPWEGTHPCPSCGGTNLVFETVGEWD